MVLSIIDVARSLECAPVYLTLQAEFSDTERRPPLRPRLAGPAIISKDVFMHCQSKKACNSSKSELRPWGCNQPLMSRPSRMEVSHVQTLWGTQRRKLTPDNTRWFGGKKKKITKYIAVTSVKAFWIGHNYMHEYARPFNSCRFEAKHPGLSSEKPQWAISNLATTPAGDTLNRCLSGAAQYPIHAFNSFTLPQGCSADENTQGVI